jgi:hypothetical protein
MVEIGFVFLLSFAGDPYFFNFSDAVVNEYSRLLYVLALRCALRGGSEYNLRKNESSRRSKI